MTEQPPDGPEGSAAPDGGRSPSFPLPRRRIGAHRAPRSRARRVALVAVPLAVVALTAALLLTRPWSDGASGTSEVDLATIAPDVVAWVEREVPEATPVAASGEARVALAAAGAGGRISGADDGLRVVEGRPDEGTLVLARFEAPDGAALSVVDPSPGQPTPAELERRQALASAVLANPVAGATGRAADVLRAGHVDARLLGLLAGLVTQLDVHVGDLPPAPGEPAEDGPPARRLLVDEAGGERLTPGAAATERVVTFLEAQRPPFAPDTVEPTDDGVLVAFDYVSAPDAVVTEATP